MSALPIHASAVRPPAAHALHRATNEQRRHRDQQATQQVAVQDRRALEALPAVMHECEARGKHERDARRARQYAVLAPADPGKRCALERPARGGPARIERKRYGERREADGQRKIRLDQQPPDRGALAVEPGGRHRVEERGREGAVGKTELRVTQHDGLHREHEHRCREHQRAVHEPAQGRRLPARKQDRHRLVEEEVQDDERLRTRVHPGLVAAPRPQAADHEGEDKADQVQLAPRPVPGDAENQGVQHEVIREQHDVIAGAGGDEHRREEAANRAEHRKAAGILQHGECPTGDGQRNQQRKCEHRRNQFVETERREGRQVQDAEPTTLQAERVDPKARPQPPAGHQQCHGDGSGRQQAPFDREANQPLIDGVLQQEGDAEERDDHADLHRHIAGGQPLARETPCRVHTLRQFRRNGRARRRQRPGGPGCNGPRCRRLPGRCSWRRLAGQRLRRGCRSRRHRGHAAFKFLDAPRQLTDSGDGEAERGAKRKAGQLPAAGGDRKAQKGAE